MKGIWLPIISMLISFSAQGRQTDQISSQYLNADSLTVKSEKTFYFSCYSPIQDFPKQRDWRFFIEAGYQRKISRFFNSDFGLAFQGYNQLKVANLPNCFSFYADFGVGNTIYFGKNQRVLLSVAYGFSATRAESTEGNNYLSGGTEKFSYYGIGVYSKFKLTFFSLKNLGISISSRYRIIPAWAQSDYSYTGYEFAIFPRFAYLQLGINYRIQ